MKESRKYVIADKVFSKTILQSLGNTLYSEYSSSKLDESHTSFAFKISCADNTSYESESLELLADGSMVDIKKVDTIEIDYYDYTKDRYANLSITHGNTYHNILLVRGNDSDWVNGLFVRAKEIIDAAKPQQNSYLRHKRAFFHLFALGSGVVIYAALSVVLSWSIRPIENPAQWVLDTRNFFSRYSVLAYLFNWLCRWCTGFGPAYAIQSYLERLWPRIEFDFGPDHQKTEKQRRIRVKFVAFFVLLPIAIAIVYDLIKALLKL